MSDVDGRLDGMTAAAGWRAGELGIEAITGGSVSASVSIMSFTQALASVGQKERHEFPGVYVWVTDEKESQEARRQLQNAFIRALEQHATLVDEEYSIEGIETRHLVYETSH